MNTLTMVTRQGLLRALSNVMVVLTIAWLTGWLMVTFLYALMSFDWITTGILAAATGLLLTPLLLFALVAIIVFTVAAWTQPTS